MTYEYSKVGAGHALDAGDFARLVTAARDTARVSGLTHNFYRYPARFSPRFVREVVEAFSRPGDLVFDPFMGGGTTLVEALALGRSAIGTDISSLAAFVTRVKTTLLSDADIDALREWASRLEKVVDVRRRGHTFADYEKEGYYRHLTSPATWRLRKAIEQALVTAAQLKPARRENFARCVILRAGQWALDSRKRLPDVAAFRSALRSYADEMLLGANSLRAMARANGEGAAIALHRSAVGIETEPRMLAAGAPRLVVTSPPYPGIHVLYHRWQVDGRKETPAPFWIANKLDGAGLSYYTFGHRHAPDNRPYFEQLAAAFQSIAAVCDEATTIVQMVAFSRPERQLPRYLEVMQQAGLKEISSPHLRGKQDGRLWRSIPNRKWHADQLGNIPASQEVVLFHRKVRQ